MNGHWRIGHFSDVLEPVSRPITVEPEKTYKTLGVQWYGNGLFVRDNKPGLEIKATKLYKVEEGDFVYNRLFAWKGSFGIVGPDTAGGVVSGEFPYFQVNTKNAEPKFLKYYLSRQKVWQKIGRISSGQANISRLRFKESAFLSMELPLPSVDEQKRIVAYLESVEKRATTTMELHDKQGNELNKLLLSAFNQIKHEAKIAVMGEIAPLVRRPIEIEFEKAYPELGIRSFGNGTFHKPLLSGADVGTKKLFEIKSGDLIFSNVFAWEGAIAVVKPEDDGRYGSHRYITCVPIEGVATAEYLCFYFLAQEGLEKIRKASPGSAGRNKTLGLEKLSAIKVPLPDYQKQLWFKRLVLKVEQIKRLQAATGEELSALLPSVLDRAFKGEL